MSLLNFDLLVATLVAFAIGMIVRGSWPFRLGLCIAVAIIGWAFRAFTILHGDATIAGDYFNGLNIGSAVIEIAVALAWIGLWYALGRATARAVNNRKTGVR